MKKKKGYFLAEARSGERPNNCAHADVAISVKRVSFSHLRLQYLLWDDTSRKCIHFSRYRNWS